MESWDGCDTLVVKHMPNVLTDFEKEAFLRHFGASNVKCVSSQLKKYNLVFAKFSSHNAAKTALCRLHQVEVLGIPLCVEYARKKEDFEDSIAKCAADKEKSTLKKKHKDFVHKLNAWHHSLQPSRPPPHHLRYEYPAVSLNALTNICRAIATVPRLYTQVLHLMNKMNLPCPFGPLLSEPEIYIVTKLERDHVEELPLRETGSPSDDEESEIEGDPLLRDDVIPTLPAKRPSKRVRRVPAKRFAMPPPVAPRAPTHQMEEMFEGGGALVQSKKIELKSIGLSAGEAKAELEENQPGGFGIVAPAEKPPATDAQGEAEQSPVIKGSITLKELRSNRIPAKDQKLLPVFKNYQMGGPSCRLYVKNISRQVEPKDLHYIFSCFLDEKDEEQMKMFDIRLMQEGRMKGQAFVTLPTSAQASTALTETNGYILKGKPLVVQFARSSKPK